MTNLRQNLTLLSLFLLLAGVSAWLQFGARGWLADAPVAAVADDAPDYYVENFESSGVTRDGKKYRLQAARLVHYPQSRIAKLTRPHIMQFREGRPPRQLHAAAGEIADGSSEVLLTGDVRILEGEGDVAVAAVATQKLRLRLGGE